MSGADIDADLTRLDKKIDDLHDDTPALDDFEALVLRVKALEKKVSELQVEEAIRTLTEAVEGLVNDQTERIDALEKRVKLLGRAFDSA